MYHLLVPLKRLTSTYKFPSKMGGFGIEKHGALLHSKPNKNLTEN
jgi:hypothetical protein